VYEGEWVDDMKNGDGVLTWNYGEKFEGKFENEIPKIGTSGEWIRQDGKRIKVNVVGDQNRYDYDIINEISQDTAPKKIIDEYPYWIQMGDKFYFYKINDSDNLLVNNGGGSVEMEFFNGDKYRGFIKEKEDGIYEPWGDGTYIFKNGNEFWSQRWQDWASEEGAPGTLHQKKYEDNEYGGKYKTRLNWIKRNETPGSLIVKANKQWKDLEEEKANEQWENLEEEKANKQLKDLEKERSQKP